MFGGLKVQATSLTNLATVDGQVPVQVDDQADVEHVPAAPAEEHGGHLPHLRYLCDLIVGGDTGGDSLNGILIYQGVVLIL